MCEWPWLHCFATSCSSLQVNLSPGSFYKLTVIHPRTTHGFHGTEAAMLADALEKDMHLYVCVINVCLWGAEVLFQKDIKDALG